MTMCVRSSVFFYIVFQDPEDFYTSYSSMLEFINNTDNWSNMEEELRGRGVGEFLQSLNCVH